MAASGEGGHMLDGTETWFEWAETFLRNPVHTSEPYFPLIGALGLAGAVYSLVRGQWFLPAWWALAGILGMRAFPTYVTVVIALLAGVIVGQVIIPELASRMRERRWAPALSAAAAGVFCLWIAGTGAVTITRGEIRMYMESLSREDRQAMDWVSRATPQDAQFAIIPIEIWPGDFPGEWFPVLAERQSIATPQGYEWVEDEFEPRASLHSQLLACTYESAGCVRRVLGGTGYTHVYVPAGCCTDLRASLGRSTAFEVVYNRGSAGPLILKVAGD
jgi:hypothetical protein